MTTALFLLDTALNSLMIAIAMRITGRRIMPGRIIAGALMGACIAGLTRAMELTHVQTALLWLPTAMTMMTIAGNGEKSGRKIGAGAALLCAAGMLGGTVQALHGATGSLAAAYMLGCVCAAFASACVVRSRRAAYEREYVRVVICCQGRVAAFEAMIDSGNTLRDYLTDLPVIVLPRTIAVKRLRLDERPMRPIFAETAGGRQMMDCLVAERVQLEMGNRRADVKAVVALCSGMSDRVPALVPAALMDSGRNG